MLNGLFPLVDCDIIEMNTVVAARFQDRSAARVFLLCLHFGNTLLLLAALPLTAQWLSRDPRPFLVMRKQLDVVVVLIGLLVTICIEITGSVAALGDTLFPATFLRTSLIQDFSSENLLLRLRFLHPVVVAIGAIYVVWLMQKSLQSRRQSPRGVYYIEWREDGQRRRQSISNRNLVLEYARLKAVEFDAKSAGNCRWSKCDSQHRSSNPPAAISNSIAERPRIEIDSITSAAGLIFRSVESYLQELIKASVRSQLQSLGIPVNATETNPASLFPTPNVLPAGAVPSGFDP